LTAHLQQIIKILFFAGASTCRSSQTQLGAPIHHSGCIHHES
jgi:hypothetical protein